MSVETRCIFDQTAGQNALQGAARRCPTRAYLGSRFPGKVRILADLRHREGHGWVPPDWLAAPKIAPTNEREFPHPLDFGNGPLPLGALAPERPPVTPDRDVSDETLMLRYQRGDRQAFAAIVSRHHRRIFNFVLRQLRSPDAAEEVTQEAFLKIVKNAAAFKHEARFSTWLYSIARNLCIDHARRMKHRRHASLDAPVRAGDDDAPPAIESVESVGPQSDVERTAAASEVRVSIVRAVDGLPDEQREVFLLRQIAELPFREIALVVGVGENTVKSRMRYALERLRDSLSDLEEYARARR